MIRFLFAIALCSLALAGPGAAAQAAPAKAKKRGVRTLRAKGPAVSRRNGLPLVELAPQGTGFDRAFDDIFDPRQAESGGDTTDEGAMPEPAKPLQGKAELSPVQPTDRGVHFETTNVSWKAGLTKKVPPRIRVEAGGAVAVVMPLPGNEGAHLKVECKGMLPSSLKMRAAVLYDIGYYTTSTAEFFNVGGTLAFVVAIPASAMDNPFFSVALRASSDASTWILESCSAQRV